MIWVIVSQSLLAAGGLFVFVRALSSR